MRKLGYGVLSIDVLKGQHCDITVTEVASFLKRIIGAKLVCGIFSGTPCRSFSCARRAPITSRFPRKLRDKLHPLGLPVILPQDRPVLVEGNLLADLADQLLALGRKLGIPTAEENPGSSLLWHTPSRQRSAGLPFSKASSFDQCAFHAKWKKRTTIWSHLWPLPRLENRCCTTGRICQYNKCKHVVLSGPDGKNFRTASGSRYPLALARAIAADFDDACTRLAHSRLHHRICCTKAVTQ